MEELSFEVLAILRSWDLPLVYKIIKSINMEKQILDELKTKLETGKSEIVMELKKIAVQKGKDPNEWKTIFIRDQEEIGHEALETDEDEAEAFAAQFAVAKSLAGKLSDIDIALDKIAKGTYGKCENCDKEMPLTRLLALPEARLCFDCGPVK